MAVDPVSNIWAILESSFMLAFVRFADALPYIIASLFILFAGYVVSVFVSNLVQKIFDRMKLEDVFKKFKVEDSLGGLNISHVLVKLLRWALMLLTLLFALNVLQLDEVTWFVKTVLLQVPMLFFIILIVLGSAILGEWVREVLLEFNKFPLQKSLAHFSKLAIVFIGLLVGLENMNIKLGPVYLVLNTLLNGLVWGIAIAFGLAFGLGGQKDAADIIKKTRKKLDL